LGERDCHVAQYFPKNFAPPRPFSPSVFFHPHLMLLSSMKVYPENIGISEKGLKRNEKE
jgi:hypothetical protein